MHAGYLVRTIVLQKRLYKT